MGVRMLNKYLREYSCDAIKEITMNQLRGKKIAIDVSIFLYQFKGDNALLENMYRMIEQFRNYQVTPIYVFDGTPPDEKFDVLCQRDNNKKFAKDNCDAIENELKNNSTLSDVERNELSIKLNIERKKCLRITNSNIRHVKELMTVMGVSYLEASGEADELCVYLVKKKLAWACMSEDMDMFVYGCQRVLRGYNLEKGTMLQYVMVDILKNLRMTQHEFKEVCLLAGTDYNKSRFTIFTTMGLFYKYLRRKKGTMGFYDWLIYTKTITYEYKEVLNRLKDMFQINTIYNIYPKDLVNNKILMEEVNDFMDKHEIKISF